MWLSRYLMLFLANFFFIPEVLIRFENMDGRFFLTLFFFLGLNLSVSGLVYHKTVLTKKSVLGFLVGSFFCRANDSDQCLSFKGHLFWLLFVFGI